ncbi:MAG TPA: hypothetical protein VEJ36_01105 [Nitrososphaerales archaeon]|nr:hypothetical protein [Nitrososphaerales archaeon]
MGDEYFGVEINRSGKATLYPFTDYFKGFERVQALRELFGAETASVLKKLRVEFYSARYGYMGVNDEDGHILISLHHLQTSDFKVLYLDIVHELFHIKQHMQGKKLFLDDYEYVDSPIEIDAYKFTVKEARRIGMTTKEIIDYLKVEWVDEKQHKRFIRRLGLG